MDNYLFPLSKFCYHHYVPFVVLLILFHHMETIVVGVISLFEVNITFILTLWNEKYLPYVVCI